jgi:hypothetical protein
VLVDAVDGHVLQHLVEANPEEWRPSASSGGKAGD